MLLALDVGNTNTVLGLYRLDTNRDANTDSLIAHWRVSTHRTQTVDEYGVLFVNLSTCTASPPTRSSTSSSPQSSRRWRARFSRYAKATSTSSRSS